MLRNHRKPYSESDCQLLNEIAEECKVKQNMLAMVREKNLAQEFGRTETAICKQIELRNHWFWAEK